MMRLLLLLRLAFAALLLKAVSCDEYGIRLEEFVRWRSFLAQDDAAALTPTLRLAQQLSQAQPFNQTLPPPPSPVTVDLDTHAIAQRTKPDLAHGHFLRSEARVKWHSQCPKWLQRYAKLHAKARLHYTPNTTSTPKLMLHECTYSTLSGCPGLGDRFRGLMETFKFAVHSSRLFLLRWESTAPLEDVLQPSLIDWRVLPQYGVDSVPERDKRRYYWYSLRPKPEALLSGAFASDPARLMTVTHADQDCKGLFPGPDIGCNDNRPPTLRSCVFHALFKPSANLTSYVANLRSELFGSDTERYVAVHLRIGGFEGERKLVRGGLSAGNQSTADVVARTLSSAQDLAAASNIRAPILVLTDNDELRSKLQRGLLPGFVSPGYKAKHAALVRGAQHREALMTSFADLLLLAQASCLIGSLSGFTHTAFMWGRHDCFLMVNGDGNGGVGQHKWG